MPGRGLALRPTRFRPWLAGSALAIDRTGRTLFALDADAGTLVVLDAASLAVLGTHAVCARPEQSVVGPDGRAYVACGDGAVVVLDRPREPDPGLHRVALGPDPFGIALDAAGGELLVTTRADARLHSLDAATLEPRWAIPLPAAPRGIACAARGHRAVVAHLVGPAATFVDLAAHTTSAVALPDRRDGWPTELLEGAELEDAPERGVGAAFAVAPSPGGSRVFVPYLLRHDGRGPEPSFQPGCYGAGVSLPVAASIAAVDLGRRVVQRPAPRDLPRPRVATTDTSAVAELGVVRAAVADPRHGRLFVVGEGSGELVAFDTTRADPTAAPLASWGIPGSARGLAVDPSGSRVWLLLPFEHEVVRVDVGGARAEDPVAARVSIGGESLPAAVAAGRKLFHLANHFPIAGAPGMSCSSCHLEGGSDGVTWRLGDRRLQTPVLAGRVGHAGPFRWGADSADLGTAVDEAVRRISGSGLPADERAALLAFLRSDALAPPTPRRAAEDALATRGAEVFHASRCDRCHVPDEGFSDRRLHDVRGTRVRTPSLRAVGASAPYYHDGSAGSLDALLDAHEEHNPMAIGARVSDSDRRALTAFLETL